LQPEFFQDQAVKERLRKLRKAYGLWLVLTLTAGLALVLAAIAGAALLLTPWAQDALRIALLGAAVAGALYWIVRLRRPAEPLRSLGHFARYLQTSLDGVRQDFETALALEGSSYDDPTTRAFALGHRRQAAERLAAVPPPVLRQPHNPKIDAAALVLWGALAAFALFAPDRFAEARQAWLRWDSASAAETLTGAKATTLVAEFQFTISPPRYTQLDNEVVTGSGELIRAYRGSSVAVSIRIQTPAEELRLTLPGGAVAPLKPNGESFAGEFVVTEKGRFSLSILRDGEWYEDATERTVELIPDHAPHVSLLAPDDNLTLSTEDELTVKYEAGDDFGFTKAALVVETGGREQRFPLPVSTDGIRFVAEKTFALREWNANEGDAVHYYVEVFDNDEISGPKRGTSKPQTIEVHSPRKEHQALLDRLERLVDLVTHALADQIELPETFARDVGPKLDGLSARLGAAGAEMLALAGAFQADPLADAASTATLEQIARRVNMHRREVGGYAAAVSNGSGGPDYQGFRGRGITTMERITIELSELLRQNRMQDMLLTAAELDRARDELKQMLVDYKQNPDPAKLEALRAKMAQIKKLMEELGRQRSAMAEALPEEFYNADAFQKAWDEHPASQLENIEKMLDGNDAEKALAEIENFERSLGDMLANLERAGQSASQQANAGEYQKLSQALQEVAELEAGQRKLAEEVREAEKENQQAQTQQAADMKKKLAAEVEKLKRETMKLRDKSAMSTLWQRGFAYYAPQTIDEVERVKRAVESGDWGGARQQLQRAESYLRSMQMQAEMEAQARIGGELTRELKDDTKETADFAQEIRKLLENPGGQNAAGEGSEMQKLEQAQAKLQERLQKLQEKLDPKDGNGPPMKQESRQALEGGEKAMENARTKMRSKQGSEASMKAEEAADQLAQARQQMEQMKQQMEQMAQGSPSGKQEGQGRGRMGANEKVEIPQAGEQKADRRNEVMKGMREGLPKAYEDLNKKYYDRLVK
jgi:hypothetical protein